MKYLGIPGHLRFDFAGDIGCVLEGRLEVILARGARLALNIEGDLARRVDNQMSICLANTKGVDANSMYVVF